MNVIVPIFMLGGMAWIVLMMIAMVSILQRAPKGQKLKTYNHLSMWNFGAIRADLGPAVEPQLRIMRRGGYAFLIFFAVVAVIAVVAILMNSANPGTP